MRKHTRGAGSLYPAADLMRPDRYGATDPLGDPQALPGRQQEFDILVSAHHSFVGFETDVHVHVLVNVAVDGFWLRSGPFEGPAAIMPPALPEDT